MTPILKVITEYCDVYVDDINLQTLAVADKPLYARRMWGYLRAAIPLLNLPANMQLYLVGTVENPKFTEPVFDSYTYTTTEDITDDFTLTLEEEYKGYALFCCRVREVDDFDNVILLNTSGISYDKDAGTVTFAATSDDPIPKGTIFDMDFYTDGSFAETLTPEVMGILGFCFEEVWQTRFSNDWLSNISKVDDKSFNEQNRANKINADTARLKAIQIKRAEAMRRYEQNINYRKIPQ